MNRPRIWRLQRRRALGVTVSAAAIAVPLMLVSSQAGGSVGAPGSTVPNNQTVRIGGPQHFCGTNGVTCAEPATTWGEMKGYDAAVKKGAHFTEYIGHDEPAALFYSNRPGSGNNVTYQMVLPKDPPTRPKQDGSGGTFGFELHPTFWLGMVMCDPNGSPNPDGAALTGHPTVPCKPDSDSNIYESTNPASSHYIGLGPGQAYEEMQFYPPGWAPWPAGIGCTAKQWCAALNIDTFSDNQNTGGFNNTACLNTVGPEPVNFAFVTKNGKATAPGSPLHPEHFIPDPKRDFLMRSGDRLTVHLFDTPSGMRVTIVDHTRRTHGSMTASAANGFASVVFDPSASTCTATPLNFHPEFSTSTPLTRNVNAAHTYNVAFSDEIGHFELCAKVANDAISSCLKPLGPDTNNGDVGPDPAGDDDFCLPASASLDVKIGGCLDTDGDFDGVPYSFGWPGSVSNPVADRLLHPTSELFSSPTVRGKNFSSMAFEADLSRIESSDTAFKVTTPCQRHLLNPSDPQPGLGCVNPPPNSVFYPIYSTRNTHRGCMWQEGGPYIPGTTNKFGGNSHAEFGSLRAITAPTAPFGTITKRLNDFRRNLASLPCLAG
jgi:hypothetical protein